MNATDIVAALEQHHAELQQIPPELHLMCPKISDGDPEDYDRADEDGFTVTASEKKQRIEDARQRQATLYWLSLVLGLDSVEHKALIEGWSSRLQAFFYKCDCCIRSWYSMRKSFMANLNDKLDPHIVEHIERRLDEFDFKRINTGIQLAESILREHGPMSSAKLVQHNTSAVLALYEGLCCLPYLAEPSHRESFNYVFEKLQERKPLRVSGVIPTMTFFLFKDDSYRLRFAQVNWENVPAMSLTAAQWDWAVHDHLAKAIKEVSSASASPAHIKRFWEGFLLIVNSMSEHGIVQDLRAMELQPDVFILALNHLGCSSPEILLAIIKVQSRLMRTSAKAFWAAYDTMSSSTVAEQVFRSPPLKNLLAQSLQSPMMVPHGNGNIPILVDWVNALVTSLPINRRTEACESILRQLFETLRSDAALPAEGQSTSTLAGLGALSVTLEGFLDGNAKVDAGTSLIYINTLLNLVVKYMDIINSSADLPPGGANSSLSETALQVIHLALALDSKAIWVEWTALHNDKPVQQASQRQSAKLWDAFLEILYPGRLELAKAMLNATLPLRSIETFKPPKGEKLTDGPRLAFNDRFRQTVVAVANMLQRLSDFSIADLQTLCFDTQAQTVHALVACLIHGQEAIQVAALALLEAVTAEDQRPEAVVKLLQEHFSEFLDAFSKACAAVTFDENSNNPWGPMPRMLKYSDSVVSGLCDASIGLLRSKTLSAAEQAAVKRWWQTQWQCLDHAFRRTKDWAKINEKRLMENFCRDAMEMADKLLSQDGLVASALGGSDAPESLKIVLYSPQAWSGGLVDMIQLRDKYLIQGIVGILRKLLDRLKQFNLQLPPTALKTLRRAWQKNSDGQYALRTNLTDQQRAELQKALDDEEDDVQIVQPSTSSSTSAASVAARRKTQGTLDFSKSGSSHAQPSGLQPRTNKQDVLELTTARDKNRSLLDSLAAPRKAANDAAQARQIAALKEQRQKEKEEKKKRDQAAIAKAKALRNLHKPTASGDVTGKDQQPQARNEIMIGSSDEEEEDDGEDEADEEMSALMATIGEKDKEERERLRQVAMLEKRRRPVKKTKVMRSAKDQRARLIPPMDELHRAILEWDIFHQGNDPPNGIQAASVSDTYYNPAEYKGTFLPLLIHEAWRSFVTAKNEAVAKPFGIRIQTRLTVDNFLEIATLMPTSANKDRSLSEGDLVIISKSEDPLGASDKPHCLARIWKTTFKKDNLEVIYRLSRSQNPIHALLNPNSDAYAVKITNMTTIEREYAALESLKYYDLMDEVLKAEPSPMLPFGDEAVGAVMTTYDLNRGQASSILSAKVNDGFTLIQGPPGTGKTMTIVAMVGALLTGHISRVPLVEPLAQQKPSGGPDAHANPNIKKLLICAPSNAAVDELVLRLKAGIKTMSGSHHRINVLRLGRSDAINAAVKDVTLDELVKARMEANGGQSETAKQRDLMHKEAQEIKAKLAEVRPALEAARDTGDRARINSLQREVDELKRRQAMIGSRIEADKDSGNTYAREAEIKRRQVQQDILDRAQVLCSTLSGSGHEMFRNLNVEFETVIIDEAAQCVELSALIPLKYGCAKCILVGDPKQLPPTVLSQSAARFGYDQSLFVRMQRNHPEDVHLLDRQYRMHPEISRFPSTEFYEGKLFDGANMDELRRMPWHVSSLLGPYRFFDVKGSQERGRKGQSLVNVEEVKVAMQLYQRFRHDFGRALDLRGKIGIITPYKAQLFELRRRFADEYGDGIGEEIEFNTTDAFQGRECEIIIFSCVRASSTGGIGFMTDIRRMNVGLTRAKSSLWILGDSRALRQGEFWAKLIEDAVGRGLCTDGDILGLLRRPTVADVSRTATASASASGSRAPAAANPGAPSHAPRVDRLTREVISVDTDSGSEHSRDGEGDTTMGNTAPPRTKQEATTARGGSQLVSRPDTYTVLERRPAGGSAAANLDVMGGLDERGQPLPVLPRDVGPPVIHGSGAASGAAGKKRALDSGGSLPPPKRTTTPSGPSNHQSQTAAKNGHGAGKKPGPLPTDPSAMQVLGIAPPKRAAPQAEQSKPQPQLQPQPPGATTATPAVRPPGQPNGAQGRPMTLPPRKKAPVDPFIKKKPKRP